MRKAIYASLVAVLLPALAAAQTTTAAANDAVVPQGTEIRATLDTPLSSEKSKQGEAFTATVADPVRSADGALVLPVGSRILGEVSNVEEGKTAAAIRGRGRLNLRFREVRLPDGNVLPLNATLVGVRDTEGEKMGTAKTTEEGEVEARTSGERAAKDIGIGAAVGTVAGLIFGKPLRGLAIGAAAGGGYVLAKRGEEVELPVNSGLVLQLDQPLSMASARTGSSSGPSAVFSDSPSGTQAQTTTTQAQQTTTREPALGTRPQATAEPAGPSDVPAGTRILATLDTPLSSEESKEGDQFTGTVADPVRAADGRVAIPVGAQIRGEVTDVKKGETLPALRGRGQLNLRFREVVLPGGATVPLVATLVTVRDTEGDKSATARAEGDEGEVEARTSGRKAARDIAIGAGIGTVAGLIFGSAMKGLAIGAIAGGGYVLATRGKDVHIPENAGLELRLDQNLSVPANTGGR